MSTSEWIASLNIAELPVNAAAANFVTAISEFPASAAKITFLDALVAMEPPIRLRRHAYSNLNRCPVAKSRAHFRGDDNAARPI